jgi:hypothetical protein
MYPEKVAGLVMELRAIEAWAIAKRGDYEYIKKKPKTFSTTLQLLELIDEVYAPSMTEEN